ncbi:PAP2 superfamily-domain-containing protein [Ilyonectria robusta]|uniref:PAP2 superfamily-domain-containing protein n=1 Tax=Ilyonectria robusta TaxID=1079257 RepID=UPI001E8EC3E1|nr:PAP2 superfamily-domain-containing protein [Ilyonectria robusta]KAH8735474.1 PAP2 superfamily-domain-containing protein [Ilyonectria robusta]
MADSAPGFPSSRRGRISMRLLLSYAFDWISLIAVAGIAAALGHIDPAKRPFSLVNPDISFPYTEHELVPPYLLIILNAGVPIVIIAIVSLIFVPGPTVPKDTPKALVWKRKLWELHIGWLGLALALVSAWFFTESMKNLFGKPRPDLLARCKPDLDNVADYIVGGLAWRNLTGQLVSADICTQTDRSILNDGFRSYPSGHSSSAAAGLIYASLFLASKFSVTVPFALPSASSVAGAHSHAAFPSRQRPTVDRYEPTRTATSSPPNKLDENSFEQNVKIQSLRLQAAAPPIYLLVLTIVPFACAVFIASSRWYDYRHHGFDILFGFLMGTATSIYAFRYYHLPIRVGAGWAWGPRSEERAFWAGVGRLGYAGEDEEMLPSTHRHGTGMYANTSYPAMTSGAATQRPVQLHHSDNDELDHSRERPPFQDVELQRMNPRDDRDDRV